MRRDRILAYAERTIGADGIELSGSWMGFEVWMPGWSQGSPDIGPPVFVLVRGETMRLTDPDEGFAVLRWLVDMGRVGDDRGGPIPNRSRTDETL